MTSILRRFFIKRTSSLIRVFQGGKGEEEEKEEEEKGKTSLNLLNMLKHVSPIKEYYVLSRKKKKVTE